MYTHIYIYIYTCMSYVFIYSGRELIKRVKTTVEHVHHAIKTCSNNNSCPAPACSGKVSQMGIPDAQGAFPN